jgi:hypothetical protein
MSIMASIMSEHVVCSAAHHSLEELDSVVPMIILVTIMSRCFHVGLDYYDVHGSLDD